MEENNYDEIDWGTRLEEAEQRCRELERKREELKQNELDKLYNSFTDDERAKFDEYNGMVFGGYGNGMRFFLFLVMAGLEIFLWFKKFGSTDIKVLTYCLVCALVNLVVITTIMFVINKGARERKRRWSVLYDEPCVKQYRELEKRLNENLPKELEEAYEERDVALQGYFREQFMDTVMINAPSSRTDDGVVYRRHISVFIDGNIYCDRLKSGITHIKVSPGYHSFRFVEHEEPINQNGIASAFREGYYGGSNTAAEYSTQIDMTERCPAGIRLVGKNKYLVKNNLTFEEFEEHFSK